MVPHHRVWHEFGDTVSLGIGHFEYTRHVTHGVFSHHFTKSHNVCHATFTVFFGTIFNHLVTTGILNVGINIRHGDTIRVQETLEKETVFHRVKLGNTQSVSQNRTSSRTTTWTINNTLGLAPHNKILHDQEVTIVSHTVDDA